MIIYLIDENTLKRPCASKMCCCKGQKSQLCTTWGWKEGEEPYFTSHFCAFTLNLSLHNYLRI